MSSEGCDCPVCGEGYPAGRPECDDIKEHISEVEGYRSALERIAAFESEGWQGDPAAEIARAALNDREEVNMESPDETRTETERTEEEVERTTERTVEEPVQPDENDDEDE